MEEAEPEPSGSSPEPEAVTEEAPEAAVAPPPAPEPEPAPQMAQPVPASNLEPEPSTGMVVATVDELAAAFAKDKAAANAKLADKVLKLTGTVDKVFVKDHLDIFYIVLTNTRGQNSWNVRCTFGREQGPLLTRLNLGQTETVQGKYSGYEKNIILKDCSLVR